VEREESHTSIGHRILDILNDNNEAGLHFSIKGRRFDPSLFQQTSWADAQIDEHTKSEIKWEHLFDAD
jgi:hypothetical protein